ncbi:hypothetical protein RF11_10390 [Thelohanellus kitauei]|uniref:Uncharacterized protein n=1 Tax=Thelohanellus kitauei TaxID=669202 RepID=A0A0C2JTC9_THEKT|nr:hypothetical protein RF11_10390 [Thelohanellus kitauei]
MNFEEILPTHASDHAAVAPEEVDPPLNKLPAAQREMTDTDRNRLRRIKKVRQKNHYEKINKHTLGNKKKEGVKKPKSEKVAQDNLKTFYRSGRKERSQKKMS